MKQSYLSAISIALLFLASACMKGNEPKDKPNIILIMSDDMGYSDIGCYGGEIQTPNLDALAQNGLRFTQFYNTARCCPTRASLLTGLHPHQAGIGHMVNDRGTESFRGDLNNQCVTIAQVLKTAGYSTFMTGKWHVTPLKPSRENPDKHNWPLQRGFDRFFGTIHGAGSFYDPNTLVSGNEFITPSEDFYYTNAISDTAARYIREHDSPNPFFLYVPYTAAHWPMHALPQDIAKYKGTYDKGWDKLREERYQRMTGMGLIDPQWKMSPAYPDNPWNNQSMKEWHAACMEVYAAMIDNMDQGIGRIIQALEEKGELENTLIFFLQDNGACAEVYGFGRTGADTIKVNPDTLKPYAPGQLQYDMEPLQTRDGRPVRAGHGIYPGPADTYVGYDKNWANASNTPFRMFKHWVHEGGISTPLIVHWPAGIRSGGEFRKQPGQLVDIMATCVEVSGAEYPTLFSGHKIHPMEGTSLVPAFNGKELEREFLYWEHEGNRAIRNGKYKLVSEAWSWPQMHDNVNVLPLGKWELYDMEADRTELVDLSQKYPDMVKELAAKWQQWAERTGVVPRPPQVPKMPDNVRKRLEQGETKVWIYSDITDKTLKGENHMGTINDPDDISAMAGYLLMCNQFETLGIVVASTHRSQHRTTPDQGIWANGYLGAAYQADLKYLNRCIGGFPEKMAFIQSCIKESGERYDPHKSYGSLENYPTVKLLLVAAESDRDTINVLCWGSLTEPAILVNHCLSAGKTGVLDKLRFIAHWTNSSWHQGTRENPENVANCREDAEACSYLKRMALEGKINYFECGAIGQHGIVSGSPKGEDYFNRFKNSHLGKIFAEGKFVNHCVDHSDAATYWVLLGNWGVSLQEIKSDGTNPPETEKNNEEKFTLWSGKIHDELLRRSKAASGEIK